MASSFVAFGIGVSRIPSGAPGPSKGGTPRRTTNRLSVMAKGARNSTNGTKADKNNLPHKVCAACGRPFSWRKKWARDWENVKFCSDRCRDAGPKP
jgi:hypothetical protein